MDHRVTAIASTEVPAIELVAKEQSVNATLLRIISRCQLFCKQGLKPNMFYSLKKTQALTCFDGVVGMPATKSGTGLFSCCQKSDAKEEMTRNYPL